jgi:hypothetical protein
MRRKTTIWEPWFEKISRKTKYPYVIFLRNLEPGSIFKLTQICQGLRSWPNFFVPGTKSEWVGNWLFETLVSKQFWEKQNTCSWILHYSYTSMRSSKLLRYVKLCEAGQNFSSPVKSQNVVENDYFTPLFRKYLEKNKISHRDFCTIVTHELDLQNYSHMLWSVRLAKFFRSCNILKMTWKC